MFAMQEVVRIDVQGAIASAQTATDARRFDLSALDGRVPICAEGCYYFSTKDTMAKAFRPNHPLPVTAVGVAPRTPVSGPRARPV